MSQTAEPVAIMPTPCPGPAARGGDHGTPLHLALLESRQRWRQFAAIASDFVFETNVAGQVTFLSPDLVLGWPSAILVGRPAHELLNEQGGPNPFRYTVPVNRRHTWFRTRDRQSVCMALTISPMWDAAGRHCGTRGIAVNVTEQERAGAATASALRRGELLDHILTQMRQEVLAPRMMRAVLEAIMRALGCAGAVVADLVQLAPPLLLHAAGAEPAELPELAPALAPMLACVLPAVAAEGDLTHTVPLEDGTIALACPCSTRFGERAALVAWRTAGRAWDADELALVGSVTGIVRIVLEHEAIQRELARQARTDPLTGLLNRRAFLEEASRRLDRLEKDGLPGTLIFLDLDRLKQLNDTSGHDAGDSALLLTSALLHRTFRPTDLIARLGGDEFAIWLDGADSLTAAERAEDLRVATPIELGHLTAGRSEAMGMSIGIATREPGSDETLEQLIQRADAAMYEVKRDGRGHWRVSHLPAAR